MQQHFMDLVDELSSLLTGNEVLTSYINAEKSDFVRFNHAKVRQPGSVTQANMQIRLINGKRQSSVTVGLVGDLEQDRAQLKQQLSDLRALLPHLPEDPHLLINTNVESSEHIAKNQLPDTADIVDNILTDSSGLDCVGVKIWLLHGHIIF